MLKEHGGNMNRFEVIMENSPELKAAYEFAQKAHEGFTRKSGESYFTHCEAVTKILCEEWNITDVNYLSAALLHDVVEDTDCTIEKIQEFFGNEVAGLVDGVSKLSSSTNRETVKKVFEKTHLNPGVAVLKLADRLHNMRTLEFMKPNKRLEKAKETMNAYTKLAASLGMWQIKVELEDLSFKFLSPKEYREIKTSVDSDYRCSPAFINPLVKK